MFSRVFVIFFPMELSYYSSANGADYTTSAGTPTAASSYRASAPEAQLPRPQALDPIPWSGLQCLFQIAITPCGLGFFRGVDQVGQGTEVGLPPAFGCGNRQADRQMRLANAGEWAPQPETCRPFRAGRQPLRSWLRLGSAGTRRPRLDRGRGW